MAALEPSLGGLDANIGLIDPPGTIRVPKFSATALAEFWSVVLDPSPNRHMIDR